MEKRGRKKKNESDSDNQSNFIYIGDEPDSESQNDKGYDDIYVLPWLSESGASGDIACRPGLSSGDGRGI